MPVTDTAAAVQRVVAERRAGKDSGGGVDLIWINGENFAAGKKAGLWLENWATTLPNARFLDTTRPDHHDDFQVPVDGQEAPWSRAGFVFASDVARPPGSLDELLAYAKANPGRFTYPAPPDFTGSAFVRQVVAAKGEDAAFAYLQELRAPPVPRGPQLPEVRRRARRPVRQRPGRLRHELRVRLRAQRGAQGRPSRLTRGRSCSRRDRCRTSRS